MKDGKTLSQLATAVQQERQAKHDYIASSAALALDYTPELGLRLRLGQIGEFNPRPYAHGQIAQHLGIPKPYYDRMKEAAPELLIRNTNHWFASSRDKRMVRTLGPEMRAFLSEKYRPLDNYDLLEATLPALYQDPRLQVVSCEITETKLYLKAVTPRLEGEVRKGDVVQMGLQISNSEVGAGSVQVMPLLYRLVCLNGAVINDLAMRRAHVGKAWSNGQGEDIQRYLTDDTRRLNDQAFWSSVRDVVAGVMTEGRFQDLLERSRVAAGQPITGNPIEVVEATAKHLGLNEQEQGSVLRFLVDGGDMSRWGLANAVTRMSQDVEDYDRASEIERWGGDIIELPAQDWKQLNS